MDETGITNLGDLPEGMEFIEAEYALADQRKYFINPEHHSKRMTLCEAAREVHRIAEFCDSPACEDLQVLAAAIYDRGKRMDARIKELKGMIP